MAKENTYEEFIQNILKIRGRFECGDEYHERHHILPKCMGGTDEEDNLIDLFAREHFMAHKLLALENRDNDKLVYAWWCMAFMKSHNHLRQELTQDEYEEVKVALSETMKGEGHPFYGKHHTEEARKKIREAHKGKSHTKKTRKKISESNGRKIVQFTKTGEFIRVWESAKQAQEEIGVFSTSIISCCKGKRKTAGGFKWQYVNELHEFIPKITTRKIVQLSKDGGKLIKIWDSVKGAAEYLGGNSSSISNVCAGRENSYKGFKWMYYEDWLKLQQKVA